MNIKRLLHSSFGKVIIPVLLGLGLATMFRKVCKDRNCVVFKAPSIKNIEKKTYSYNGQCYKYKHKAQTCDKSKKTVEFA